MEKEVFQLLKKKIDKDLELTDTNILEKSLKLPLIYSKYLDIFMKEYRQYNIMLTEKEELVGNRFHFYKFDYDFKLSNVKEIECHVYSDSSVVKKSIECFKQEEVVKYLEKVVKMIEGINYTIKNYIDFRKFQSGQ